MGGLRNNVDGRKVVLAADFSKKRHPLHTKRNPICPLDQQASYFVHGPRLDR